jgi:hypothetical protein
MIMKRLFALCFVIVFLLSCKDDIAKINNKGIISRKEFVEILADIHLIDAITDGSDFYNKFGPSDSLVLYSAIFKKHHVTKEEFDSTVSMYIRQPEVYMKVYDEVLLKLNYMLDTLRNNDPLFSHEVTEK